jgi:transcriptional regulator with XRE-family HTH domain
MANSIDYQIATSELIRSDLGEKLEKLRLLKNITQKDLAKEAGVSLQTVFRAEKGVGISLDSFVRVLSALDVQDNLKILLPDSSIRPIERAETKTKVRKRASSKSDESEPWEWGDEG